MDILNIFNNREIAISIWFVIFLFLVLVISLTKKKRTKFLPNLIKSLFHWKVITLFLIIFIYSSYIVIILYFINFWDFYLLKDTIIWVIFTGIVTTVNSITSKDYYNLFKKIIYDNFKIIFIIEFAVNAYTFHLIAELFIVPTVFTIVFFDTVASTDKRNVCFSNFLKTSQILIFLAIFSYSIYKIVVDYNNFFTLKTLKDISLAPVLTISFIPLIYLIVLFTNYEQIFFRLNFMLKNSKEVNRYAKKEIIKYCLIRLKKVNNILKSKTPELIQIRTKQDVKHFIRSL